MFSDRWPTIGKSVGHIVDEREFQELKSDYGRVVNIGWPPATDLTDAMKRRVYDDELLYCNRQYQMQRLY